MDEPRLRPTTPPREVDLVGARTPRSLWRRVLEILRDAETARVDGELGIVLVVKRGRVIRARVQPPQEQIDGDDSEGISK